MALVLARPLDFALTLRVYRHGRRDPACRLDGNDFWWAARTPAGPGTLHLRRAGDQVDAEAWGPGGEWLVAQAPQLVGEQDDPAALAAGHPVVQRAAHRHPGLRIGRSGLVVRALTAAVLEQRVTAVEALRAWAALCRVLGGRAPGPSELLLPPDPERLAEQPSWWYHRFSIERRRADTLRRVGHHAVRLQEAATMARDDAYRRLLAVSGIGPWTAATAAGPALGDPDAVAVGDFHLPNVVAWALAGEARADDARMLELLEPFAGERGRVIRLLLADGHSAPAFGPRRPLTPIARW